MKKHLREERQLNHELNVILAWIAALVGILGALALVHAAFGIL